MLTEREQQLLWLAGAIYKHPGYREQVARDSHGLSPTQFYAEVNRIIDTVDALEHDAPTVYRLRRLRDRRRAARSAG